MAAPERLNVLLSRARNALIMIGNAHTFTNARKGSAAWTRLFEHLKGNGHIYDGFPVRCERHTKREALLKCGDDFDKECPDGGCSEPWCFVHRLVAFLPANGFLLYSGKILNCGIHSCPSKCHQISDHSKMACTYIMEYTCPAGHRQSWKCHKGPPLICLKCERDKVIAEKKKQEDFALQKKRDEDQQKHTQQINEFDAKIKRKRDALRDAQIAEERKQVILQKEKDLKDVAQLAAQASQPPPESVASSPPNKISSPPPKKPTPVIT